MFSKILRLRFPKTIADKPMVSNLVSQYDLTVNIFQAVIYPRREGHMVLEVTGHRKNFNHGVKYLRQMGVKVETVGQDVRRNDDVCYQCGLCTSVCPTGALAIKRPEMEVVFDSKKCTACELCVVVCPPKAMEVSFNPSKAI